MTDIEFEQPAKRMSLNDRTHWTTRADLTRHWRKAAAVAAHRLGAHPPSLVQVSFPVTTAHRRDRHNAIATVKPIIDGLVDAGVWPDDTDEYVIVLDPAFHRQPAGRVHVTITPRTHA